MPRGAVWALRSRWPGRRARVRVWTTPSPAASQLRPSALRMLPAVLRLILRTLPGDRRSIGRVWACTDNSPKGRNRPMPLFMDIHDKVDGATSEAVAGAHQRDLDVQGQY